MLYCRFPRGQALGEPGNPAQQREVIEQALKLLVEADHGFTTREFLER